MPEGIFRAGHFELRDLILISSSGKEVDLTVSCVNITIFESLDQQCVTGELAVMDSVNLTSMFPIIGQEYLKMRLATPTVRNRDQMIDYTKNALMVTHIDSKVDIGNGSQGYVINFCSRELVVNERVRVNGTLRGSFSDIVKGIMKNNLESGKNINVEPTADVKKMVAPNVKPLNLIAECARQALSSKFNDPCYVFFETTKGFNFRSLSSLYAQPSLITYEEFIQGTKTKKGAVDVEQDMRGILDFSIVETQDSVYSNMNGSYGSTLYTHDIISKSYQKHIYNYLDNFDKEHHIESTNSEFNGDKKRDYPIVSDSIISKDNKRISDFPGRTYVVPVNGSGTDNSQADEFNSNVFTSYRPQFTLQRRNSQMNQLNSGFIVNLIVHGNTAIAAGDIVDVNIPYTASTKTPRNELYDNIYKGKFLVSKVRHDFYPLDKSHVMNVQVVKDSLPESLPSGFNPEIVEDNPNFNEEVF